MQEQQKKKYINLESKEKIMGDVADFINEGGMEMLAQEEEDIKRFEKHNAKLAIPFFEANPSYNLADNLVYVYFVYNYTKRNLWKNIIKHVPTAELRKQVSIVFGIGEDYHILKEEQLLLTLKYGEVNVTEAYSDSLDEILEHVFGNYYINSYVAYWHNKLYY